MPTLHINGKLSCLQIAMSGFTGWAASANNLLGLMPSHFGLNVHSNKRLLRAHAICFPATTEARSDTHSLLRLRILGLNQIQWHCHVNYTSTCSGSPHLQTAFNICAMEHMIWQIANAIHFVPIEREVPRHVRDFWHQLLAESAHQQASIQFAAREWPRLTVRFKIHPHQSHSNKQRRYHGLNSRIPPFCSYTLMLKVATQCTEHVEKQQASQQHQLTNQAIAFSASLCRL